MWKVNNFIFNDQESAVNWIRSEQFKEYVSGAAFPLKITANCDKSDHADAVLQDRKPWMIDIVGGKFDISCWEFTYMAPWHVDKEPTPEQEEALTSLRSVASEVNAILNQISLEANE